MTGSVKFGRWELERRVARGDVTEVFLAREPEANGVPTDLLSTQMFRPTTAWREFRIDAIGDELTFVLDGEVILQVTDTTHPSGQFGIGYHEYFTDNANIIGTRADNFAATETPDPLPVSLSGLLQR